MSRWSPPQPSPALRPQASCTGMALKESLQISKMLSRGKTGFPHPGEGNGERCVGLGQPLASWLSSPYIWLCSEERGFPGVPALPRVYSVPT